MPIARQRDPAAAVHRLLERAVGTTKVTPAKGTPDRAPVEVAVLEELVPMQGTGPTRTPPPRRG